MCIRDSPETLSSLRQTASNAAELTAKLDAVGGDVETLTSDPVFMDGLRNVTIGLGALFSEVYPAKTSPFPVRIGPVTRRAKPPTPQTMIYSKP